MVLTACIQKMHLTNYQAFISFLMSRLKKMLVIIGDTDTKCHFLARTEKKVLILLFVCTKIFKKEAVSLKDVSKHMMKVNMFAASQTTC